MHLHALDIGIIVGYFLVVVLIGLWVSRRGAKDLDGYFLGGKTLPWYMLGVSDASGMFDISGTMGQLCLVTLPIYLVLRQWNWAGGILVLLIITTGFMKFRWFDRLEKAVA